MRRLLMMLMLGLLLSSGVPGPVAASPEALPADAADAIPGSREYRFLRSALDYISTALPGPQGKLNDVRVSPFIRFEAWLEVPIETGWIIQEKQIPELLQKLSAFGDAGATLRGFSATVSVSAENTADGTPLLVATLNDKLMFGKVPAPDTTSSLTRAFSQLFTVTTFSPAISKMGTATTTSAGRHWLTNVRIDSDRRLQMTGYGLDLTDVTKLGDDLLKTGAFQEVFITSMNRNIYQKTPVWRFDLVTRIR